MRHLKSRQHKMMTKITRVFVYIFVSFEGGDEVLCSIMFLYKLDGWVRIVEKDNFMSLWVIIFRTNHFR